MMAKPVWNQGIPVTPGVGNSGDSGGREFPWPSPARIRELPWPPTEMSSGAPRCVIRHPRRLLSPVRRHC